MANIELLKYLIAREKHTQDDIADLLGFSRQALQTRLNGTVEFRLDEIRKIQNYLHLSNQEVTDVFLS